MAGQRDYYEVLGVAKSASAEEIRKAYKKLALANHPDRNPGDDAAVSRFKEAAEAYEILSDSDKRARYDRYGHAGVQGNSGGHPFQDVGDIFEHFSDLFEGFGVFGGGQRRRGGGGAQRGAHLRTAVTIDLVTASKGCTRELTLNRKTACGECDGTGAERGSSPHACDYCGGRGQVVQSQGFFRVQTTCPACRGSGRIIRNKCGGCGGTGRTDEETTLEVRIPAGIDNGMQLCLRGEGEAGVGGGPRGDLYVDVHVREHKLFRREGVHLLCTVPVTYTQAALGATIEAPLLDGSQDLEIPAGTQPGEVFRVRGQGMPDPHGGRRGDLHLEIELLVPKKLDDEHEALLRQLANYEQTQVSPHQKSWLEKLREFISGDEDEEERD
ncbi:MAG: molecular chaperone DnaJ [Planctomyces sp.]|nr:molecular chaperone DnaJ [Planctomyces sp.]